LVPRRFLLDRFQCIWKPVVPIIVGHIDLPLVKLKPLNTGKIITVTNRKRFWFGTDKKCGGVKLVSGIPPITS
jgi:hypothetical protein